MTSFRIDPTQTFARMPENLGVRSELTIEGVWLYPGEYLRWKYRYDEFTKETILTGYEICHYGGGSGYL